MVSPQQDAYEFEVAAEQGDLPRLRELLGEWRALPTKKRTTRTFHVAVLVAIESQQLTALELLLGAGATPFKTATSTALSGPKPTATFQILLKYGWDPNQANAWGTQLWRMALFVDEAVVKLFLENGADINAFNRRNGTTALDEAAGRGDIDKFKLLLSYGADLAQSNPLHSAAGSKRDKFVKDLDSKILAMMKYLIDEVGLGVNTISRFKASFSNIATENGPPLCPAIRSRRKDRIELLLERGADPAVKTITGRDAFEFAKRWDPEEGLAVLQEWKETKSS